MDHVAPDELVQSMLFSAEKKANLSIKDLLIRSFLAGAILSFATSLAFVVSSQGLAPVVSAILFPVGFVILVLLGLELATGNFAILPAGWADGKLTVSKMLRNWVWVYAGNLAGSLFYAVLFYAAVTSLNSSPGGNLGELFKAAAQKKTLGYAALGLHGWEAAFIKGILCNWMVTLGAVLAMVSRSTVGKILAMWLPIFTFFAQGFEHSIVNMYVIPTGKLFGAPISIGQWLLWNQLPVTLGNIFAGALLTGLALYWTYKPKKIATIRIETEVSAADGAVLERVTTIG